MQSVLKLTSKRDLPAFYNNVAYLTPVMKHNITGTVSYGEGGRGCQYFDTLYLRLRFTINADLYLREQ